jgi:putative transcriptional regulator
MTKAVACLLLAGVLAWTQDLAVGKILVASSKSYDADFAQTVVLLVRHDKQGTVGLFLNRPLTIPLSEVYPDLKGGQLKLWAGGPLTVGIRALYRSSAKPAEAAPVLADVSIISTKTLLAKMVAAGTSSNVFRVYAGYTGWSGGQLRDEVARGLWHIMAGDAGVIFDPHPETVWSRLIGRLARGQSFQDAKHVGEVVGPGTEAGVGF